MGSVYVRISASQCCAAICSLYTHPCFHELLFLLCCLQNFPSLVIVFCSFAPFARTCVPDQINFHCGLFFFSSPACIDYSPCICVYCCPLVAHQIGSPGEFHCSDPFSEVLISVKVTIDIESVSFLGKTSLGAQEQRTLPGFPNPPPPTPNPFCSLLRNMCRHEIEQIYSSFVPSAYLV